jgi:hypothetical protein
MTDKEIIMSRRRLLERDDPAPEADIAGFEPDSTLAIVDTALASFTGRDMLSREEVVNRLLDLRNALAAEILLRELEQPGADARS